jgi:O-antigen/teichoic acid export membrane protein
MESIPYMLVQGAGRPDITTKLLMFELPFYVALIWWLTKQYGINGAAIAWLVRVSADTVLLMFIGNRILPVARASLARLVWGFAVCVCALFAAMGASSLAAKLSFLGGGLAGFAVFAWLILLSGGERAFFRSFITLRAPAAS